MATARRRLLILATVLVLSAGIASAAEKNLLFNPSFEEKGDDPIPWWKVRTQPGRTTFRVHKGVLEVKRTERANLFSDRLYQTTNLPATGTTAVRVTMKAAWEGVERAEVELVFRNREGLPLDSRVVFVLRRDSKVRVLDRDVPLPEGTRDLTVALVVKGPGLIRVNEMGVYATDRENLRPEARVVRVTAEWKIGAESGPVRLPIPPSTATQAPIALRIEGLDGEATLEFDDLRTLLAASVGAGPADRVISGTVDVVVMEHPDLAPPPDSLPVTPARHLPRRLAPFAEPIEIPRADERAKSLGVPDDLRDLAERVARLVPSTGPGPDRARLATALFRLVEVPARIVALAPIGGEGPIPAAGVFEKERGWILFGTGRDDPRPLPFLDCVVLGGAPAGEAGADFAVSRARAEELGTFLLPPGSGPDLVEGLDRAFRKAARGIDASGRIVSVRTRDPELRGRARRLKQALAPFLED